MRLTPYMIGSLVSASALLSAPSIGADDRDHALDKLMDARSSYYSAEGDLDILRYAADELSRARSALNQAERLWEERADGDKVEHFAFLTLQQVDVAKETSVIESARADAEHRALRAQRRAEEAALSAQFDAQRAEIARFEAAPRP